MGAPTKSGEEDKFSTRKHVQLSKALEVLELQPTSFHAIQAKPEKLKELLERTLKKRTLEHRAQGAMMRYVGMEQSEQSDLSKIYDESTIHEAYQFLVKTYV